MSSQYQKSLDEVNETFQFYVSMLEERKGEVVRELEQAYSSKQVSLSVYSQKAQETVEKILQVWEGRKVKEILYIFSSPKGNWICGAPNEACQQWWSSDVQEAPWCSTPSASDLHSWAQSCLHPWAGVHLKLSSHSGIDYILMSMVFIQQWHALPLALFNCYPVSQLLHQHYNNVASTLQINGSCFRLV